LKANEKYDICVVGLGYIGLPTASIFAARGKSVLGVDVVSSVVETINAGKVHIVEPDLDLMVRAAVQGGQLLAATNPAPADCFIVAVPTPFEEDARGHRKPDLSYIESACLSLAPVIEAGDLVILESTSPVGTTEKVREWIAVGLASAGRDLSTDDILFAHCPERILPGQMLQELVTNDRMSGGLTPEAAERATELYRAFCTAEIFETDARTAEMVKLVENASRDVSIAFANELSIICDSLGIDVWDTIRLANRHPRVNILQPGPGVGGHCIAVDPWFIVDAAPNDSRLIQTAREVNNSKPFRVIAQVVEKAARFKEPVIACFGIAFKPNVDDLRESPAKQIAEALVTEVGDVGTILVVEPNIEALPESLSKAELVSAEEAVKQADIAVILVRHREFERLDTAPFHSLVVIDTVGLHAGQ